MISMTLDVSGVISYAQHHGDVDLLLSTFPDLTPEQAFAIVEGGATIQREGTRYAYSTVAVH